MLFGDLGLKTIVLLRHADSYSINFLEYEHEQPISVMGLLQIEQMNTINNQIFKEIEFVLCSNTKRARQTFQAIYQNINSIPKFMFDDNLHQITESELKNKIQWTPAMYNTILVVGHNPCLSQFMKSVCSTQEVLNSCECAVLVADVNSWQEVEYNRLTIAERVNPQIK